MPDQIHASYAHCEALLGEEDRDAWLACLFAPVAARPKLHALGAFAVEIGRVRERVRDPLAGEVRLQWWEDAILGGARGDVAAHPVAAALLDTIATCALPAADLIDAIEACRWALYDEAPAGLAALDDHLDRRHGRFIRLAAVILAGPETDVSGLARHAGIATGIAATLRNLPRLAAQGRAAMPDDVLRRHGLDQGDLRGGTATPPIRAALAELRRHGRDHIEALRLSWRTLPESVAPAFLAVNLCEALLRASEDPRRDPFVEPPIVPQWRRQWVLWRAARRGGLIPSAENSDR